MNKDWKEKKMKKMQNQQNKKEDILVSYMCKVIFVDDDESIDYKKYWFYLFMLRNCILY